MLMCKLCNAYRETSFIQAENILNELHKYRFFPLSMCVYVWFLHSSDLAICEWSPVQYPAYSLCETWCQRDGEIAEMSSSTQRKQTQFVLTLRLWHLKATNTEPVFRRGTPGVMQWNMDYGWDYVHPVEQRSHLSTDTRDNIAAIIMSYLTWLRGEFGYFKLKSYFIF